MSESNIDADKKPGKNSPRVLAQIPDRIGKMAEICCGQKK